jgi:predicted oxidoreductase
MGLAQGKTNSEMLNFATRAVMSAVESGFTLFDNADIYSRGKCEELFGQLLKNKSSLRDSIIICTKGGIRADPHRWDFSHDYIVQACEGSLQRLGVDTVDIYLLHRPDFLADPEEIGRAFSDLTTAGKVRYFGVSNMRPTQVDMLSNGLPFPLIANQVQISLLHLDCLEDGILDQCMSRNMTPMAWGPVAGGYLAGRELPENTPERGRKEDLLNKLDEIAGEYGTSRDVIALAWLRKHPSGVIPIIGTTRPERIKSAARSAEIELSREHWYELLVAARGRPLP